MRPLAKPIIALFVCALLSIVLLGMTSRMVADDYCFTLNGVLRNPIDNVTSMYNTWSGTYSEVFFKSLVAPWQRQIQPFATLIFTVSFWGVSVFFLRQVCLALRLRMALPIVILLAGLWVFLGMNGAPTRQNLYWFALLFDYNLPIVLIIFYTGCLVWLLRQPRSFVAIITVLVLTSLCVFVASGMSEVYASGQIVGLLVVGSVCVWRLPSQRRTLALVFGVAFLVALLALGVILSAPGNAVREAEVTRLTGYTRPPIGAIILPSLAFTLNYSFIETFGLAHRAIGLVATLLLLVWAFPREQLATFPTSRYPLWLAIASAGVAFAIMGLLCAPSYYGVGDVVPRTVFFGHIVWVAVYMLWGYLLAVGLARYARLRLLVQRPLFKITTTALVLLLVFFPTVMLVYHLTIAPNLVAYAQDWDARDILLLKASPGDEKIVMVAPYRYNLEDYLALEPITLSGENTWVGNCASAFYGLDAIRVLEEANGGT